MFFEPKNDDHGLPYNPFKACVVPRPIGWITTLSYKGIINLAPFSISNQLAYDPPFVFFSGSSSLLFDIDRIATPIPIIQNIRYGTSLPKNCEITPAIIGPLAHPTPNMVS